MTRLTLAQIMKRVVTSRVCADHFTIAWHAGEPLTLPIDYYRNAIELVSEFTSGRVRVTHNRQTNGTRVNQDWCDFFLQNDIHVGISIDGPQSVHDIHRTTRGGKGTHRRVLRGLRLLRENGIPVRAICVLTRDSLGSGADMARFFLDEGISEVGFNIDEIEGVNATSTMSDETVRSEFRRFLEEMADEVAASATALRVRELADMTQRILFGRDMLSSLVRPFHNITVSSSGAYTVYAPELLGFEHPRYGNLAPWNVWTHSFEQAAASPEFALMRGDVEKGVALCRQTCQYFDVCGGGSPSNKLFETGTFASSETLDCTLTKQVVADMVLSDLEHATATSSPLPLRLDD
jgi:uncharacterized protein